MTDRELLEKAAKAAGIDLIGWREIAPHGQAFGAMLTKTGVAERTWWNPLTDDGDALRLAVKLRLSIQPSATTDDFSPSVEVYDTENVSSDVIEVKLGADPYAATRRCIVRAAASIGPTP